jgi:hypothetical protein
MGPEPSAVARLDASRALLSVVDLLAREFPDIALPTIYEKVGEARGIAARHLPDVAAYRLAIEREARARLVLDYSASWAEISAGTSAPAS